MSVFHNHCFKMNISCFKMYFAYFAVEDTQHENYIPFYIYIIALYGPLEYTILSVSHCSLCNWWSSHVLPVRVRMINTENISGYSAKMPGAFMDMYCRQKCSICFPISSSNVALQARATLEVPKKVLQIK